ncbi:MAG: AMP-binding protein [Dehalococcoidales bacterium]|nr:AMP-binding protein [Dehalococcoidales bacterium]
MKERYGPDGAGGDTVRHGKGTTWPQILRYNALKYGSQRLAMRSKRYGIWRAVSWEEYYLQVKYLALGLASLGFRRGDRLLIIGDNAPQWNYATLAAQANHGISVGMYSDLSPQEIVSIARSTEAKFVVAEDQEQLDKLLQIKATLPHLEKLIYWRYKGLADYHDAALEGMRQVILDGRDYETRHPDYFEENVSSGAPQDTCSIIYTSGTTDEPKGTVHTHASTMAGAEYLVSLDPLTENDNIACSLPPAWILEYLLGIGCHLLSGSILNFAEEVETQQQDMREIGPDLVYYSARQWESQAGTVQARVQGADFLKRFIYRRFMPVGYAMADDRFRKRRPGLLRKLANAAADFCLFRPIRDSLGLPNARICYTSGAILSPDAFRFFHALGIPLKSIYGTTEGGILSGAPADDIHPETTGRVAIGTEVGIKADGEIVYRQPGKFSGYYNDTEATSAVLKDGWFYSGDTGLITEDGQIIFVDRKNDLVQLACGETLAPQYAESRLKYSPYIRDAWVITEPNGPFAAAVIIIDYTNVGKWASRNGLAYTTFSDLCQKSAVCKLIEQDIVRINADISPGCRIRKYVNLHKEFDPDEGELTRDRKLRRGFLRERYSDLTKAIFSGMMNVEIDTPVQYRDGRVGTVKTTVAIHDVREVEA